MNSNSSIYRKLWEILIFFCEIYVRMWVWFIHFVLVEWFFLQWKAGAFPYGLRIFFIYYIWFFCGVNRKAQLFYQAGRSKYNWCGDILLYSSISIIKMQFWFL